MIKKLIEENREEILDFLSEESSVNLFMIGDIEQFGFESDMQELYGDYDGQILKGVLLRFNENFIPYYKSDAFDVKGFSEIIEAYDKEKMISGKESIVIHYKHLLDPVTLKPTHFCEVISKDLLKECKLDVKIAKLEDAQRIFDFIDKIEEFSTIASSVKQVERRINTNLGRIYYVEDEQKNILTVSQTTAENSQSAMIIGVATKKEARGQGLMSQCLSKLCSDLLDEGKKLCLFYDNPEAGKVYHRIGFKSIDNWLMMTKQKD